MLLKGRYQLVISMLGVLPVKLCRHDSGASGVYSLARMATLACWKMGIFPGVLLLSKCNHRNIRCMPEVEDVECLGLGQNISCVKFTHNIGWAVCN